METARAFLTNYNAWLSVCVGHNDGGQVEQAAKRKRVTTSVRARFMNKVFEGTSAADVAAQIEQRVTMLLDELPPPILFAFRGCTWFAWCAIDRWHIGRCRSGVAPIRVFTWRSGETEMHTSALPTGLVTSLRLALAKDAWDGVECDSPVLGEWEGQPAVSADVVEEFHAWVKRSLTARAIVDAHALADVTVQP
jgi:hypothetical protein